MEEGKSTGKEDKEVEKVEGTRNSFDLFILGKIYHSLMF
jgi:hypothetical protein